MRGMWTSRSPGEALGKSLGASSLPNVVQLGFEGLRELLGEADDVVLLGDFPVAARGEGEVLKNLQVLRHLLGDPGAAHLHDHLGPVEQSGRVDLPDRGRGERRRVEAREDFFDRSSELLDDDVPNDLGRDRRRLVLKMRELAEVLGGQKIGAGRENLAELNERRAQLAEGHPQAERRPFVADGHAVADQPSGKRQEPLQTDDAHDETQAVAHQHLGNLAISLQMGSPPALAHATSSRLVPYQPNRSAVPGTTFPGDETWEV